MYQGNNIYLSPIGPWTETTCYEPFGTPIAATDVDARYTDHEYDQASALHTMKGRFQDPAIAKFTRPDPNALKLRTGDGGLNPGPRQNGRGGRAPDVTTPVVRWPASIPASKHNAR